MRTARATSPRVPVLGDEARRAGGAGGGRRRCGRRRRSAGRAWRRGLAQARAHLGAGLRAEEQVDERDVGRVAAGQLERLVARARRRGSAPPTAARRASAGSPSGRRRGRRRRGRAGCARGCARHLVAAPTAGRASGRALRAEVDDPAATRAPRRRRAAGPCRRRPPSPSPATPSLTTSSTKAPSASREAHLDAARVGVLGARCGRPRAARTARAARARGGTSTSPPVELERHVRCWRAQARRARPAASCRSSRGWRRERALQRAAQLAERGLDLLARALRGLGARARPRAAARARRRTAAGRRASCRSRARSMRSLSRRASSCSCVAWRAAAASAGDLAERPQRVALRVGQRESPAPRSATMTPSRARRPTSGCRRASATSSSAA